MTHERDEEWKIYLLPASILIASLVVSAAVFYSATVLSTNMINLEGSLKATISALELNFVGDSGSGTGGNNAPPAAAPTATPVPDEDAPVPMDAFQVDGEEFKGAEDGKIVIVKYSEFECPFCKRASPTVQQILDEYPDDVKFYFQHFPLSFHAHSMDAAEAFECAGDQGKAYEMYTAMFEGDDLSEEALSGYAGDIGLDVEEFDACMADDRNVPEIEAEMERGAQLGVQGTPSFFINGVMIVGAQPYEVFKAEIDSQLADME